MSAGKRLPTYSTDTVRYGTLKWLAVVFVRLVQSQRIVTVTAKYGTALQLYSYKFPLVYIHS
jgi:hypothetical protein